MAERVPVKHLRAGSSPAHPSSIHYRKIPCGCDGRMTVFETVGRGSIPRRGAWRIFSFVFSETFLRDRLTVGRDTLNVAVLVRIQLS